MIFAYCESSVPLYTFAIVFSTKNQLTLFFFYFFYFIFFENQTRNIFGFSFFFFFFLINFQLLITILSVKIFQHQLLFFQVLAFSYKTFNKNLLTKNQISCSHKTDTKNFFISKKDESQIICKKFETKNSLSIFAHICKWVMSLDCINFN